MSSSRDDAPVTAGGKGRPTPKRREKERRRTGPVPPPPLTRKEAAQRKKEEAKSARQRIRSGALAGDERYLPKRDAGPVRRLVRDLVDSRRNAAVLLLPVALLLVVAQITRNPTVIGIALTLWLAALLTVFLDMLLLAVTLRRRVRAEFPDERTRGHVGYGLLRATVFRRWRMPAPAVSPGDKV
ncbi:MAG TPA: DUF3043 domain-containing protein [Mycobacteriales bacterium]|nr:DUF3043 domain-containing protein [Mycobacteriales bacterium]